MVMNNQNDHLKTLSDIRSMMERSSRFISLSGLSGVSAGIFALLGAAAVYIFFNISPFEGTYYYEAAAAPTKWGIDPLRFLILDAAIVLICALASGIFFTTRQAKQKGQKIWGALTQRLLISLAIPLVAGGLYCIALMRYGMFGLVAPTTLIFYGLALLNASKYTFDDVRYLGICEIVLGLIAINFLGYGLEFWAIGFGILHIIYGTLMYNKYERTQA